MICSRSHIKLSCFIDTDQIEDVRIKHTGHFDRLFLKPLKQYVVHHWHWHCQKFSVLPSHIIAAKWLGFCIDIHVADSSQTFIFMASQRILKMILPLFCVFISRAQKRLTLLIARIDPKTNSNRRRWRRTKKTAAKKTYIENFMNK